MRALDVILGVGVAGVAVLAARLIADAASKNPVTVSLPSPEAVEAAAEERPSVVTPAFQPVRDCAAADANSSDCWCWGEGRGTPECNGTDYSVFFDGQSIQK